VEEQPNNRVNVSIAIEEGQAARIKAINLVGNHAFTTSALLKSFTLSPTNYMSWVSQADQYDKQKLSADLEALRTFYLDRGYLNFRIISTQVAITPDKQDIYITINMEEGDEFVLSGFQLAGNTILPESELLPLIELKDGEVFSRAKVANVVKKLSDRLGQEGYAFAKVNPVPDIQEEDRTVKLTFYIEPGNKIYVRKVMFEGNTKTKDEVIRREIIQMESAPVNTKFIEDSKLRLNRTGYFTDVKVETRPVSGTTDEIDIVFTVEEASSGQLGGGVGYSDVDGLLFNANIS
ncbi:MAG TPA: outer membrane protein assembly factor BamA, partial [Candidatus Berkiella sp.]|nr:outer membrane protein assembly factor BamA [Candidatus Berkiella sp.]